MQIIKDGNSGVLQALCKAHKKWGLMLVIPKFEWYEDKFSYFVDFYEDLRKAAPIIDRNDTLQSLADGIVYIIGTQSEIEHQFDRIVGDDGPTSLNSYSGPVHVYALTCDDNGQLMNENT